MHRLDRINAKKPAKLLDSKSLTLGFSRERFGRFFMFLVNLQCHANCLTFGIESEYRTFFKQILADPVS